MDHHNASKTHVLRLMLPQPYTKSTELKPCVVVPVDILLTRHPLNKKQQLVHLGTCEACWVLVAHHRTRTALKTII